ncbi:Myosin-like protein [Phytophthora cinnamomi]|uniref:Myosin-like protein n=1 Tax=Phytophthora cinnamomi TaxID=4785 RepID=UPI00355AA930|nr:Myosin-like protein [Phytophthora cinnamomi]KAG6612099.1 Myosin-like protein [Phytophthora cinnamomi]
MLLQRLVVMLYSLWALLQRVKHKKWLLLVLASFYMGLRSTQKNPVVGKPRDVFINQMITVTKDDGIHMAPTPVLAPWTNASFECVGWKRIQTCREPKPEDKEEETTPEPEKDFLGCSEEIGTQMAGYCIVRNRTSGDLYKLMVSSCDSLPNGYYTCDMARDFSEFGYHSVKYEHTPVAPSLALPYVATSKRQPTNGVLMIIYDRVLPSAYATIRMLRMQGCELPVELWYRPDEMSIDNPIIHKLLSDYNHDVQGNLVFFHRNSIKLDGKPDQPRIMGHIQEYSLEGNPRDYRIFQAVNAHKECCYYIGTDSLPDGRPATQVTPIDSTIYASIEDLAIQFSVEARQLLIDDALANDLGFRSMRVQYIVALFLLAYVLAIITFVWCKGRPARERLPSRWKPVDSKES